MTQLHAGGKFGGENSGYNVSGGLHGVGVSVVNALSTRLEATVMRDGHEWFQYYDRSVPGTLKQGGPTKETGTTIRFWADPDIFETTEYDFETVARRLQEMAFLNKGLTIDLDRRACDRRGGRRRGSQRHRRRSQDRRRGRGGGAGPAQGQAPHLSTTPVA